MCVGTHQAGANLGEFSFVTGLCVNEDNTSLIVADAWNHRINILN